MIAPSSADLASLSSLVGTLTPEGILSQWQAEQAARQLALAQQTAATQGSAQSAEADYNALASAPPPNVGGAGFVPQLFGNVASVLSGDSSYAERGAQTVRGMQNDLMQSRHDNLTSLREIYSQKAKLAEQAGDFEAAEKARVSHERMSKALEVVTDKLKMQAVKDENDAGRTFTAGENAKERQLKRDLAAQKAAQDKEAQDTSYLTNHVTTTRNGQQFLDASQIPAKGKIAAFRWAKEQGIPAIGINGVDHLKRIETARQNIDSMLAQADAILPADPQERLAGYGKRKMSQLLQTKEERAAWQTWRISAIQQLTALAGGTGSGFRINKAEIEQAIRSDIPTLNDTYEVAVQKANNLRLMLDHTEGPILSHDWSQGVKADTTKAPTYVRMVKPDGKTFRDVPSDKVPEAVDAGWKRAPR